MADPLELRLGFSPDILSPTSFRQASDLRRSGRTQITDVESGETSARNQRRRLDPQPSSVNIEGTRRSMLPPPAPPRPINHTCSICLGPMVEETATSCGHVFCNACIRTAISTQGKCPMCRCRITHQKLLRLYFSDHV